MCWWGRKVKPDPEIHVHAHVDVERKIDRLIAAVLAVLDNQETQMASLSDLRSAQGQVAVAIGAVFSEIVETADALSGLRSVIATLQGELSDAQANAVDQDAIDAALAAADRLSQLAAQLDTIQKDPATEIPAEPEPIDELPPVEPETPAEPEVPAEPAPVDEGEPFNS